MDRKVLVIAVVICLDLAFILLLRGSDPFADLSAKVGPPPVRRILNYPKPEVLQPTAEVEDKALVISSDARPAEVPEADHVRKALPARFRSINASKVKIPAFRRDAEIYPPERFTDKIIWLPANYVRPVQVEPSLGQPKQDIQQDKSPARKKRSVFDRALPVVKKPYDWIKSLASKLT